MKSSHSSYHFIVDADTSGVSSPGSITPVFFFYFSKFCTFFVSPKNFRPSGEKKHLKKFRPSGEKTKTKMLGLQAKNSSNGGRCDGIIIVLEAEERAQREFFSISGVI